MKSRVLLLMLFVSGIASFLTGCKKDEGTSPVTADSSRWTIYNSGNAPLPSDKSVNNVFADESGNIWAGIWDFGVLKFDGQSWTSYNTSNSGLPSSKIDDVKVESNGTLWVATFEKGIAKFSGGHWTAYSPSNSGLSDTLVTCIEISVPSSIKWIGARQTLYRFDEINWVAFPGLAWMPEGIFTKVNTDETWVVSQGGRVLKYDGASWSVVCDTLNGGWCIKMDSRGNIWVGTNSGLAKYDGLHWTSYNTSNSPLPVDWIDDLAIDKHDNIWIATRGIVKFDGTNWIVYNNSNSPVPSTGRARSITIDSKGRVIVGLSKDVGGGIAIYDSN